MDAGLAAVVAGASGAGGAALAGWVTGQAMIRQVRAQAQSGFDERLRDRRQEAYVSLLSACDAVHDALDDVIGAIVRPLPPDDLRSAWRAVNQALNTAHRAARTASVAGPADIARQGLAMHGALLSLVNIWRDPTTAADARAIAHAHAHQVWVDAEAYMVLVQQIVQKFDSSG
ncbi:hypothetical protein [Streptomyces sp. 039-1]|uniref:hypothetical protein n=1 Tax=Streptomyces sp. 039-1 TaxID=2789263 RepID=UPI0039F486FD